jgi:hypothetical protein
LKAIVGIHVAELEIGGRLLRQVPGHAATGFYGLVDGAFVQAATGTNIIKVAGLLLPLILRPRVSTIGFKPKIPLWECPNK